MATPPVEELPAAGSSSQQALTLHDCSPSRNTRIAVLGGSFDPITDGHLKCACEIIHARKAQEVWIVPCGTRPDKPSLKTPYMHRLIMCHLAVNTTFGSSFPIRVCDIEMAEARCPTKLEPPGPATAEDTAPLGLSESGPPSPSREQALSTYHLMKRLKQDYPGKDFCFVLGADLLDSLKAWDAPGVPDAGVRLWNECDFLVLDRPGYEIPDNLPPNFIELTALAGSKIVTEEVSSSEIRRRIGKPVPQQSHGGVRERRSSSTGENFGESEKHEIEQAMSSGGNFEMVDGLLTPAVLAHIIRYRLYSSPAV